MINTIEEPEDSQDRRARPERGLDVFRSSFWISPEGKLADLGGGAHINAIVRHPAKFGLTRDEIDREYETYGEPVGMEGKAREALILSVVKKGFVRIRLYPNRYWSVSLHTWSPREQKLMSQWASFTIERRSDKHMPVRIGEYRTSG